jgi:protein-S-isoprenylcysteine O-methyltransferase Ste14
VWRQPDHPRGVGEVIVLAAVALGIWILPAIYVFTNWIRALDYDLPPWTAWPATTLFALGLLLRWRAQVDLGRGWSPTLELSDRHRLVTDGVYGEIRHPLYSSLILWGAAQPVLLQNLLAGWVGPVAVLLIWLIRVPAEEKMLLRRFGDDYARYEKRTGRVFPRWR